MLRVYHFKSEKGIRFASFNKANANDARGSLRKTFPSLKKDPLKLMYSRPCQ